MFNATDKISVELTASEWNEILSIINSNAATTVFDQMMGLLRMQQRAATLATQIAQQAAAQDRAPPPPPPQANGSTRKGPRDARVE